MNLPLIPTVRPTETISPSLFDDALQCHARAAWRLYGQRRSIPSHPSALLGQGYHGVMEAAIRGELFEEGEVREDSARAVFDELMRRIFDESHPLIRIKFPTPQRLPYYNLYKERAVQKASDLHPRTPQRQKGDGNGHAQPTSYVETEFISSDGLIKGRPDYVDCEDQTVIDYKSGAAWQLTDGELKANEERQVLLYGYLLLENGVDTRKGRIERADGRTAEIVISREAAEREAEHARQILGAFNAKASQDDFAAMATPSPVACAECPCKAICPRFWEKADDTWQDAVGVHLEGTITQTQVASVGGVEIATCLVDVSAGTIPVGQATVEQVPTAWMGEDPTSYAVGSRIRVTDGKIVSADPVVVRADNVMTVIWGPL